MSKKLTCNPSSIDIARQQSSPARSVLPEYTAGTLIRRKSCIRTKHEITARKGTKYTVNTNKLTFSSAFFQPRSTFAVQQHGRTVVAKNAGSVHSSRALPARVGVVAIFAPHPYFAQACVWLGEGRGVTPRIIGCVRSVSQNPYSINDQNLWFSLPYLWPDQKFEPNLWPALSTPDNSNLQGKLKKVRVIRSSSFRELKTNDGK